METKTINHKELEKIIRESSKDVLSDKKNLTGDAANEARENVGLALAIEEGRTGEYVGTAEFKKILNSKLKRL